MELVFRRSIVRVGNVVNYAKASVSLVLHVVTASRDQIRRVWAGWLEKKKARTTLISDSEKKGGRFRWTVWIWSVDQIHGGDWLDRSEVWRLAKKCKAFEKFVEEIDKTLRSLRSYGNAWHSLPSKSSAIEDLRSTRIEKQTNLWYIHTWGPKWITNWKIYEFVLTYCRLCSNRQRILF